MRLFVLYAALLLTGCLGEARLGTVPPPPTGGERDETRSVRVSIPDGRGHSAVLDQHANRISRRDTAGRTLWSAPLDGYIGLGRPPHLLADAGRVYVPHSDGVTALNASTGVVEWHSPGPAKGMHLSGELLLAAGRARVGQNAETGCVVARSTATGAEVFRVPVGDDQFDPTSPIEEIAGLFLVQELKPSDAVALLFDRKGHVRHRFDRYVITVTRWSDGYLVLTNWDVVLLTESGTVKWSVPLEEGNRLIGGGLLKLSGSAVVAFRYCPSADSGVTVMRFDANRGEKTWEVLTYALGVTHSGYNHAAEVVATEDRLTVTSRGSGGTIVEVLDAKTGREVSHKIGSGKTTR